MGVRALSLRNLVVVVGLNVPLKGVVLNHKVVVEGIKVVGVGAHKEAVAAVVAAVVVDSLNSSSMVDLLSIKEGEGEEDSPIKEVVEGMEVDVALVV